MSNKQLKIHQRKKNEEIDRKYQLISCTMYDNHRLITRQVKDSKSNFIKFVVPIDAHIYSFTLPGNLSDNLIPLATKLVKRQIQSYLDMNKIGIKATAIE